MPTNSERLESIRKLTDELKQGTLHGPIPTKTTMQLVIDIDFLLDSLTSAREEATETLRAKDAEIEMLCGTVIHLHAEISGLNSKGERHGNKESL